MTESPTFEQPTDSTNTEIKVLHPSVIALFVVYLKVAIPVLIVHLIVVRFTPDQIDKVSGTCYIIFCILWLLEMVRRYFNSIYYFYPTEIYPVRGRISLSMHRTHVKYIDIRETRVTQSLLGRILNYGTVTAGTAATAKEELVCYRIDQPQVVSEYIQEMIKKAKRDLSLESTDIGNE